MSWKDEFLKLYLTKDAENIKKALKLKQENLPQKFYRYRTATDTKYLESEFCGNIFLPYIGTLNDPFDTCSVLNSNRLGDNFAPRVFREDLEDQLGYKLPDELFLGANWYEKTTEFFLSKQLLNIEEYQEMKKILKDEAEGVMKRTNSSFNEKAWALLRVACFSEKLNNLPMWNHYANAHKGICFEYDIKNIMGNTNLTDRIFPVYYVDCLPTAAQFLEKHRKDAFVGMFEYFAIHKLEDWSYEKEWRLVINLMHENHRLEEVFGPLNGQGINYEFLRPSKVYIGAKAPEALRKIVRNLSRRYDVNILQMQYTEYGLQAIPITE